MRPSLGSLVLVSFLLGIVGSAGWPTSEVVAQPGSERLYLPSLWSQVSREEFPPVPTTTGVPPRPTLSPGDTATQPPTPAPTEPPTAVPTSTPEPTATPVLGGSIYGRLKIDGQPVFPGTGDGMGPALYLQRCRAGGSVCENIARTGAWEPQGGYRFRGLAPLQAGEFYRVVWWNEDLPPETIGDYTAVGRWFGPRITQFSGQEDVPGGDFELKDVVLTGPSKGTGYQGFPWEFTWGGRRFPNESFRWAVCDCCLSLSQRDKTLFMSPPLGARYSYVVESLPPGLEWNVHYCWYVRVDSAVQYSYGESFYAWMLWFIPLLFDLGVTEPADWYPAAPLPSSQTWWSAQW